MSLQNYLLLAGILMGTSWDVSAQTPDTAGTYAGSVSPGQTQIYVFTPSESGQFIATLSWDNADTDLVLVLVCGTSDPMNFGVAGGQLSRFARLESGVVGLVPCGIGVGTVNAPAAYRLNLQRSTDQLATLQAAMLTGPQLSNEGTVDARLIEQANRAFAIVRAQLQQVRLRGRR